MRDIAYFLSSSVAISLLTTLGNVAFAADGAILPPEYSTVDSNFVDFASAKPSFDFSLVKIGSAERPLAHSTRFFTVASVPLVTDAFWGVIGSASAKIAGAQAYCSQGGVVVTVGTSEENFCISGANYNSVRQNGSTLVKLSDGSYSYTRRDGAIYTYTPALTGSPILTRIQAPDGLATAINYSTATVLNSSYPGGSYINGRISSVTRNDGLMLKYSYASENPAVGQWNQLASVVALNRAIDTCNPTGSTCTYPPSRPSASFSMADLGGGNYVFYATDSAGGVRRVTMTSVYGTPELFVVGYKPVTSPTADVISYNFCNNSGFSNVICTSTRDGGTWTYGAKVVSVPGGGLTTLVTTSYLRLSPLGVQSGMVTYDNTNSPRPAPLKTVYTEDGKTFIFDNNSAPNRLQQVNEPSGIVTSFYYDSRGNITSAVKSPNPLITPVLPNITVSASYDTACTAPAKCNKPNTTTDALNYVTSYEYDATHGGLTKKTLPADTHGVQPQTRYTYTLKYAYFKNSSGVIAQADSGIWLLTKESSCKNGPVASGGIGCQISGDEVLKEYDYGPANVANNLFLRGVAVTADGLTRRTCYAYDDLGNKVSETSANAALTACP